VVRGLNLWLAPAVGWVEKGSGQGSSCRIGGVGSLIDFFKTIIIY